MEMKEWEKKASEFALKLDRQARESRERIWFNVGAIIGGVVMVLAFIFFLGWMSSCRAADFEIGVNTVSHHFPEQSSYNDANYGPEVTARGDRWQFQAGEYRNTFRRDSYYLAADYDVLKWGPVRVGMLAGVVTGYPKAPTQPAPLAGAAVSVDWGRAVFRVIAFPKVSDYTPGLIHAQVGFLFQ